MNEYKDLGLQYNNWTPNLNRSCSQVHNIQPRSSISSDAWLVFNSSQEQDANPLIFGQFPRTLIVDYQIQSTIEFPLPSPPLTMFPKP
jgi:hypothetical protein